MNIARALKQMDAQIKAKGLEAHQYSLFRGQVGVVLLTGKRTPSRPIRARGIAIQNPLDDPSPRIRLFWAKRRALHAYTHRSNSEPIVGDIPIVERTRRVYLTKGSAFKSQYKPEIPDYGPAHQAEVHILVQVEGS